MPRVKPMTSFTLGPYVDFLTHCSLPCVLLKIATYYYDTIRYEMLF